MEGVKCEGKGVGRGEIDVGGGVPRAVAGGAVVGLCLEGVVLVLVGRGIGVHSFFLIFKYDAVYIRYSLL